jgi:hypothetical protein
MVRILILQVRHDDMRTFILGVEPEIHLIAITRKALREILSRRAGINAVMQLARLADQTLLQFGHPFHLSDYR